MIDTQFLDNLPTDPLAAMRYLADRSGEVIKEKGNENEETEREVVQLLALALAIIKKYSLGVGVGPPSITEDRRANINNISGYFQKIRGQMDKINAEMLLRSSLSVYERELDVGFHYEFSEGEIERLQVLINAVRHEITIARYLDEEHRKRLLARLEKLQAELHKRVSDLDAFLGVMVQIGAVTRRFGEDAKPLVDRVREMSEIVAGVFRRAEKLPPGPEFPSLPKSDESGD